MKSVKLLLLIPLTVLLCSCQKEIVSLDSYSATILENAVMSTIPHIQSNREKNLLAANSIKTMSLVKEATDSTSLDSLTYIEFDRQGRIIRRTTKENTSIGCFNKMYRQEFIYEGTKLKKVNIYTFKYKAKSVLENWIERDTSRLLPFDWEDYSYKGDTTIVESGFAKWKYIKDKDGNIVHRLDILKANNQLADFEYTYTPTGLTSTVKPSIEGPAIITKYSAENNIVLSDCLKGTNEFSQENIYDEAGLLIGINHFTDKKLKEKITITYSYY